MAVRALKNQFRGINAHLQSYLLEIGDWASFHTIHLGDITKVLRTQLYPLGYTANIEQSLQIRRSETEVGIPESDITIYDLDLHRATQPTAAPGEHSVDTLVLPLLKVIPMIEDDQRFFKAIAIYEQNNQGEPVAWVELLSPSNKQGRDYRQKRFELLQSGLVFVEIDYLHTSPATIQGLPRYKGQRSTLNAHPYRILVIDPRPVLDNGQVYIQEFDVDDPMPQTVIPLSAGDKFSFDFNTPYQKTYEEMGYGNNVDYTQLPANFDQYSEADQLRIIRRMLAVIEAQEQDLAQAPLPIAYPDISLSEAQDKLKAVLEKT